MQPEQKKPLSGTSSVEVPLSVNTTPPTEPVRGASAKWYVAGALSFFILAGAGIGLFYHFDGKLQLADWRRLATEQRIDSLQKDGRIDTLKADDITSRELTVLGSATIKQLHTEMITISGDAGIEGTATAGALVVRGATVLAGETNIAQGLSVDGDSTIAKAFNVDGTTTLKSLVATGKVSYTGSQDDLMTIYPTGEKDQTVFVVRTLTGQDTASLDASGNFILAGGMTVAGELIVPKATVGDAIVGTFRATKQASFTATPSGSAINQGVVYINPASASASDTLLGAAVGGAEKFRVDASGNVYGSSLVVTGSVTSGNTTVNNLEVLSNTVLGTDSSDTTTINGSSTFNAGVLIAAANPFTVGTGATTLGGNVAIGGTVTVTGATALGSTLSVSGGTSVADLISSGQVRLTGNAADRLLIQPTVDAAGTTKVFTVKNAAGTEQASLTNDGTLNLVGAANVGGTLGVTGATTLGVLSAGTSNLGALTVVTTSDLQGNTTVGGTFGVTGATTLASLSAAATSLSSLSVSGTSTLSGNATMGAALNVTGNATLSANLTVAGTTTMNGGMNITGPTTMVANTSTTVPLVVRGAASQTADLLQTQNGSGTVLSRVDAAGMWYLGPNARDLHSYNNGLNSGLEFGDGTGYNFVLRAGGNNILSVADTNNADFVFSRAAVINGSYSGLQVTTGTSSNGPVIIAKNGVAATGDLQQWQNSAGTVMGKVTAGGGLSLQAHDDATNAGYFATRNVAYATASALTVQAGNSGNSGQLFEAKNAAGTVVAYIDRNGIITGSIGEFGEVRSGAFGLTLSTNATNASVGIGVAGSGNSSALHVRTKQFNFVGQILQGLSGQTADLLQAQDSTGAVMASIGATGDLAVKNTTVTGTLAVTGSATFSGTVISWSNNVRGVNQTIGASATSTAVAFATAYPDASYAVNCTPNYNTTCWVTGKTTTGFTINYGTAAPADGSGRVDWFVAH